MSENVRPTKRALTELGLPLPSLDRELSFIDDPLIKKAQTLPEELAAGSAERIRSVRAARTERLSARACATRTNGRRHGVTLGPVIDAPHLSLLGTAAVKVGTPVEIGATPEGVRRIIPITGGTITGPELRGDVLPGGADFQLLVSDTVTHLEAKYAVRTEEGEHLYIDNFGIRTGSPDDMAALVRGEQVDASRIYFRCSPRITVSGERWAWLSSRIIIGTGIRLPDEVRITFYVVD